METLGSLRGVVAQAPRGRSSLRGRGLFGASEEGRPRSIGREKPQSQHRVSLENTTKRAGHTAGTHTHTHTHTRLSFLVQANLSKRRGHALSRKYEGAVSAGTGLSGQTHILRFSKVLRQILSLSLSLSRLFLDQTARRKSARARGSSPSGSRRRASKSRGRRPAWRRAFRKKRTKHPRSPIFHSLLLGLFPKSLLHSHRHKRTFELFIVHSLSRLVYDHSQNSTEFQIGKGRSRHASSVSAELFQRARADGSAAKQRDERVRKREREREVRDSAAPLRAGHFSQKEASLSTKVRAREDVQKERVRVVWVEKKKKKKKKKKKTRGGYASARPRARRFRRARLQPGAAARLAHRRTARVRATARVARSHSAACRS